MSGRKGNHPEFPDSSNGGFTASYTGSEMALLSISKMTKKFGYIGKL